MPQVGAPEPVNRVGPPLRGRVGICVANSGVGAPSGLYAALVFFFAAAFAFAGFAASFAAALPPFERLGAAGLRSSEMERRSASIRLMTLPRSGALVITGSPPAILERISVINASS